MRISFYLDNKTSSNSLIMGSISWNGNRVRRSTGQRTHPNKWNQKRQKCSGSNARASDTNMRLARFENQVIDHVEQFRMRFGRFPTCQEMTSLLDDPRKLERLGVMAYLEYFIDQCPQRISPATGNRVRIGMIKNYQKLLRRLPAFAKQWNRPLIWESFDLAWYRSYVEYCSLTLELAVNTIGKDLAMIKTVMRFAYEDGHHTNEFFRHRDFRILRERAQTVYLNTDELETLENLNLDKYPGLARARDTFLIGCWTGLRFGDWFQLPKLMEDRNADQIRLVTSKTGEPVVIPIFDPVRRVLEKYEGQEFPPMVTNQKFNSHLKRLGELAGFNQVFDKGMRKGGQHIVESKPKWEFITTHTARRSFASNLFHMGVDEAFIMRITGHTTTEQFRKYIRVESERTAAVVLGQVNSALRSRK